MAVNRKYAALPDLDSAPDIYETPDLIDDTSTLPTTTARSQSGDEIDYVEDETDGVSRSRLRIDEARSRFLPAHVDANRVDFSDRVDGKRKSYKASSRRQRILENGTEELGDFSDEENEEDLDRKLARLKKEIEEAKEAYGRRNRSGEPGATAPDTHDTELGELSDILNSISKSSRITGPVATARLGEKALSASEGPRNGHSDLNQGQDGATYTLTYAPAYEQSHALSKAASFDRRLLMLEQGLGIESYGPETGENGLPRAVLPTLDLMEKQISTLSQASTSSLDAISRRVRTLVAEQDRLNESREKAKDLREELGKQATHSHGEISEQDERIKALYGTLPTIESLTPMLPPLLDRLRSLRAIHTDAATASQTLERVEQQQSELTGDLKKWRIGLEKLESTMQESQDTVQNNMTRMESWIREFEERMDKLLQ